MGLFDFSSKNTKKTDKQYFKEGLDFEKLGRHDEAVTSYDNAIAINPDNADVWNSRGIALENLRRYSEALTSYTKAIAIKPEYAQAWFNKGDALRNLGRYDEAVTSYDRAIAVNPNNVYAWNNRGVALENLGLYSEALISFNKAVAINPSFARAWFSHGDTLCNLGRYDEAVTSYDKAIAINPSNAIGWFNRGIALENLGRHDEAVTSHDKAIAIDPDKTHEWDRKGNTLKHNVKISERSDSVPVLSPAPVSAIQEGMESAKKPSIKSHSHHDIFITYSNKDKPVADAVCASFESHSIRCWIAPRDVPPGEDFPKAIIKAINGSRIMVLIFSSHANISPHVTRELTKALSNGLIIIPFRIEDVPLSESMEYLIGLPHWLDALTPPLEQHIDTLVKRVNVILEN